MCAHLRYLDRGYTSPLHTPMHAGAVPSGRLGLPLRPGGLGGAHQDLHELLNGGRSASLTQAVHPTVNPGPSTLGGRAPPASGSGGLLKKMGALLKPGKTKE